MDVEKIRVGDFLTYCGNDEHPEVYRVVGFERFDRNSGEMAGKVFSANVIFALSQGHVSNFERFYLERSTFSTEMEIKAWKLWANQQLKSLQKQCKLLGAGLKARRPKSRIDPPVSPDEWRGFTRHWTYQWTH